MNRSSSRGVPIYMLLSRAETATLASPGPRLAGDGARNGPRMIGGNMDEPADGRGSTGFRYDNKWFETATLALLYLAGYNNAYGNPTNRPVPQVVA